ncbi:hypothetical protein AAFF_G00341120 [Aldrovandia affinis]|uniref:Uncharacterized protein n=1 Tax=Aldrovandia affinis TaxID=143900 RepID=A0AAD7WQ71_9TELE|nr:hypothetical protein AAFF_G00341120 [Aldrovandia affinis]
MKAPLHDLLAGEGGTPPASLLGSRLLPVTPGGDFPVAESHFRRSGARAYSEATRARGQRRERTARPATAWANCSSVAPPVGEGEDMGGQGDLLRLCQGKISARFHVYERDPRKNRPSPDYFWGKRNCMS